MYNILGSTRTRPTKKKEKNEKGPRKKSHQFPFTIHPLWSFGKTFQFTTNNAEIGSYQICMKKTTTTSFRWTDDTTCHNLLIHRSHPRSKQINNSNKFWLDLWMQRMNCAECQIYDEGDVDANVTNYMVMHATFLLVVPWTFGNLPKLSKQCILMNELALIFLFFFFHTYYKDLWFLTIFKISLLVLVVRFLFLFSRYFVTFDLNLFCFTWPSYGTRYPYPYIDSAAGTCSLKLISDQAYKTLIESQNKKTNRAEKVLKYSIYLHTHTHTHTPPTHTHTHTNSYY